MRRLVLSILAALVLASPFARADGPTPGAGVLSIGGARGRLAKIPAAALPSPTSSALGGVKAGTAGTGQVMTGIGTDGGPIFATGGTGGVGPAGPVGPTGAKGDKGDPGVAGPAGSVSSLNGTGGNLINNSDILAGTAGFVVTYDTINGGGIVRQFIQNDGGATYQPSGMSSLKIGWPGTPPASRVANLQPSYSSVSPSSSTASSFPVIAGKTYEFSLYTGVYRTTAQVIMVWQDASGATVSQVVGTGTADTPINASLPGLQGWVRLSAMGTAPAGATQVQLILQVVSNGESNPYVFSTGWLFAQTQDGATSLSAWRPGGNLGFTPLSTAGGTVTGTLGVNGAINGASTLSVTGNITSAGALLGAYGGISGNLDVTGNLSAAGNLQIGNSIGLYPDSNGRVELGPLSTVGTPYVDFHSSGSSNDYDARVMASGGTSGASGSGYLDFTAALARFSGSISAYTPACSNIGNVVPTTSWVRNCQGWATFQDFGAVGDGAADDTSAVNAALSGGRPILCYGHFKLTSAVYANLQSGGTSFVQGAGRQGCQIIEATTSAYVYVGGSTPDSVTTSQIVWHDVAFLTTVTMPSGHFVFNVGFPATGASLGRTDGMVDLRNITINGTGQIGGGWPFSGIHLYNVLNSVVDNVNFTGNQSGYQSGSVALMYDGNGYPVTTSLRNITGYSVDTCIYLTGTWQGVKIEDPTCVTARVGVLATTSYAPGIDVLLTVSHTDYAVTDFGVQAIDVPEVNVVDSHIYLFNSGNSYTSSPQCVSMTQTSNSATAGVALFGKYTGNYCDGLNRSGSGITKYGFNTDSLYTGAHNQYVNVSNNFFNGLDTGINLGSGSRAVYVGPNFYTSVTNHVANAGANNVIAPPPTTLGSGVTQQ